jgi:shikimate dehydrogenase
VPLVAVLGWPLAHTLSPRLHQAAYRAAGLRDWRYEARPTRPGELPAALGRVRSGELAGVNLTTPHKQAAVPLVDRLEPPADALGAVNTVWPAGGGLVGGNTDVAGAGWALDHQLGLAGGGWDGGGPAVLLGTGGAALAVALAWARLAEARAGQGRPTSPLVVAGRDPARVALVAGLAGPGAVGLGWDVAGPCVARAVVLVQATTLTARGEPVPGQDRLGSARGLRLLDLNYGPQAQGLVAAARAAGAEVAVDGLGMLCAQAAAAVARHTGVDADLAAMAAAVGLALP